MSQKRIEKKQKDNHSKKSLSYKDQNDNPFMKAFRYVFLIRFLKKFFPFMAVAFILLFVFFLHKYTVTQENKPQISLDEGRFSISNALIESYSQKEFPYTIRAQSLNEDVKDPDKLLLSEIDGSITLKSGKLLYFKAPNGIYRRKDKKICFNKSLTANTNDGESIFMQDADFDLDRHYLSSNNPIRIENKDIILKANAVKSYLKKSIDFYNGVYVNAKAL